MSLDDRIESLRSRHGQLERQLAEENGRPHPDYDAIGRWKREKLKLKDEISRLMSSARSAA
jgi:hypothetical protein